jgi:hypothetical protein
MNETSKMYENQIKNLLDSIDKYSAEIDKISAEIRDKSDLYNAGNFVHYKEFMSRQNKIKILNKKIKECVSTISYLADKVEYDESDFANDANMVKLRAEITSITIPNSVPVNTKISWNTTIRNVGFDTWDKTNARLEVQVIKEDSLYDQKYQFLLGASEQISLGNTKTFSVAVPALADSGVYDVKVYMANDTYNFERVYKYVLYVTE